MSEKNVYESIRDDVGGLAKNAFALVVLAIIAIVIIVVKVLIAIVEMVVHLLFFAAIVVLLAIPIYVALEYFYYRRFARAQSTPERYRRRRARVEGLLEAVVDARATLERHIDEGPASNPNRVKLDLATLREQEDRFVASLRCMATVEANWLSERLTAIHRQRLLHLRRVDAIRDQSLRECLTALHDEALIFESQLKGLREAYGATPDPSRGQPFVVYARRFLDAPFRALRCGPYAPRTSALLSWPLALFVLIVSLLSSLIVIAGFSAGLPR